MGALLFFKILNYKICFSLICITSADWKPDNLFFKSSLILSLELFRRVHVNSWLCMTYKYEVLGVLKNKFYKSVLNHQIRITTNEHFVSNKLLAVN